MRIRAAIAMGVIVVAPLTMARSAHSKTENISPVQCVPANGAALAYNDALARNVSGGSAGVICPLVSVSGSGALSVVLYYTSPTTLSCSPAATISSLGTITWFPAQSGSGINKFFVWSDDSFGGNSQTHYNLHCTVPNNGTIRGVVLTANL
jgi:hypothetical protein